MNFQNMENIVEPNRKRPVRFDTLIPRRVRNILLVASMYDSFTFIEDGRLNEALFTEYVDLNLRYTPRIDRVSSANEAIEILKLERYDLIISMMRVGDMHIIEFGGKIKKMHPGLPIVLLAYNTREQNMVEKIHKDSGIDRVFVWNGDVKLFLAIIKYVEDRQNAWHDARAVGVRSIILIEDSIRFYSVYLPLLYTEIMEQTHLLMNDGFSYLQKVMRLHARPKVLHATTFEEGMKYYDRYQRYVMGVITDASFLKDNKMNKEAGIIFARTIKERQPDCAVLLQSSNKSNAAVAKRIGAAFLDKRSSSLLRDLRKFMQDELGFSEFVFRRADGSEIISAEDLGDLLDAIKIVPEESLLYHARRRDFSTWLAARTEFDLARRLRSKKMVDNIAPVELRKALVNMIQSHLNVARVGIVSDFSGDKFDGLRGFTRIGTGSLGGKGRGLAFLNLLMETYRIKTHIDGAQIFVPPSAILATDVFEKFLDLMELSWNILEEKSDLEIANIIMDAKMPFEMEENLRAFLTRAKYPLAVRSSSLLEDASYQPFAGVYNTFMIPNNDDSLEVRLEELIKAIKYVYASMFLSQAKSYLSNTPNRLEEEKMAVVIQPVVGRRHGDYLYPDISGVIRSYNFYPMKNNRPEDGIASVALGLGKTVVEGRRCFLFEPRKPKSIYDFMTPRDFFLNAQREFAALDLSIDGPNWEKFHKVDSNLKFLDLDVAVEHGTFADTGSVYVPSKNIISNDHKKRGVKLITMAGVLNNKELPLAETLSFLLDVGETALSCPVEIEFAANIRHDKERKLQVAILQIRPLISGSSVGKIKIEDVPHEDIICKSDKALGNGITSNIKDIIFVDPKTFVRAGTREIAEQIGEINERLAKSDRRFLLIGPGRWGSRNWRLGIPVTWGQISSVACIVETALKDFRVNPSQGSHFFQNITSFEIGYFTINEDDNLNEHIDNDWLRKQKAKSKTEFVKHICLKKPFTIAINSKDSEGVIYRT